MFVYREDPLYPYLARKCKKSGDNFAVHEGLQYEHITTVEEPYFRAVHPEPNPDLFDHDVSPYDTDEY